MPARRDYESLACYPSPACPAGPRCRSRNNTTFRYRKRVQHRSLASIRSNMESAGRCRPRTASPGFGPFAGFRIRRIRHFTQPCPGPDGADRIHCRPNENEHEKLIGRNPSAQGEQAIQYAQHHQDGAKELGDHAFGASRGFHGYSFATSYRRGERLAALRDHQKRPPATTNTTIRPRRSGR